MFKVRLENTVVNPDCIFVHVCEGDNFPLISVIHSLGVDVHTSSGILVALTSLQSQGRDLITSAPSLSLEQTLRDRAMCPIFPIQT